MTGSPLDHDWTILESSRVTCSSLRLAASDLVSLVCILGSGDSANEMSVRLNRFCFTFCCDLYLFFFFVFCFYLFSFAHSILVEHGIPHVPSAFRSVNIRGSPQPQTQKKKENKTGKGGK